MTRYHINKKGIPAPCKATKGNCPLGGAESHFSSQEEAQSAADSQNANAYGILPQVESNEEYLNENTKIEKDGYKAELIGEDLYVTLPNGDKKKGFLNEDGFGSKSKTSYLALNRASKVINFDELKNNNL